VVKAIKVLYCANDHYDFGGIYEERVNGLRVIRKIGKPWVKSSSVEEEEAQEEKRVRGFKDSIDRLEGELRSNKNVVVPSLGEEIPKRSLVMPKRSLREEKKPLS
jgi:hypothetical protein